MSLLKVGSVSALPPGSVMEAEAGGNTYAICNAGGQVYALEGTCPHAGGPLGEGALHDHTLVCPWHGWEYDCRTGQNTMDPDVIVPTVPVKLAGDDILIDVP